MRDFALDDAQEIGYRRGLIKGRELQKQEDITEFLVDLNECVNLTQYKRLREKWEALAKE